MWVKLMQHPHLYWWVLFIGLSFCVIAVSLTLRKIKFLKSSLVTNGEIISNELDSTSLDDVWFPVIKFEDQENRTIQFSCVGSGPKKQYSIGDLVSIRYDPEKPKRAYINKFWRYWFAEFVLWVLGLGWCWGALRNL